MDKKILGFPIIVFVLGFIVSVFASIPTLYTYSQLSQKIDRVDLQAYQKCSFVPILATPAPSQIASSSASATPVRRDK